MDPSPTRKLRLLVGPAALITLLLVAAAPVQAAALTGTNVEPASLVAGATSIVTVSFTTVTDVPADGKIVVVFPSGFDVSGANSGACSTMDGTFTTGVAAQAVTLARTPGTIETAGAETCSIAGIRNPQVSGSTGTYTIRTTDALDATLDEDTAVVADTITAGALTATNVQPASLVAGATGTVTVSFTTSNPIPLDGRIVVAFPAGFDVSGANGASCSTTMGGAFATSVAGQVVTITRSGGASEAAAAESCTIAGVRNPQVSGTTGTYQIDTTVAAGTVIDREVAVAADTITAGALTATNVQPASLVAGATGTVTVSFTTSNPIPLDGKVTVTFPAGFDVSGANGASCSTTMGGAFATGVAGQVVTITRSGGASEAAAAESCTVAGIRNPVSSGATGTYTIRTANAADAAIDEDTAVAADTITAAALTATDVQPASLVTGTTNTVTVTFTTTLETPADGKVEVTFPAGFDASAAAGGSCSTMPGTFATTVAGQVVTITRQNDGAATAAGAQSCTIDTIRNPATVGTTGTYTIRTRTVADAVIEQDAAVTGDPIVSGGGGGGSSGSKDLGSGATSLAASDRTAGAVATYDFSLDVSSFVSWFNVIRITFPEGFEATSNPTSCSVVDPSSVEVQSLVIESPNVVVCDIGYVSHLARDSTFAFQVEHILNPQATLSESVLVELVTRSGSVRAEASFPVQIVAAVADPAPSPSPSPGPSEDGGSDDTPRDGPTPTREPTRSSSPPPEGTDSPDTDAPGLSIAGLLVALGGLLAASRLRRSLR